MDAIKDMMALRQPQSIVGFEKIRVGGANDGGYVKVDNFERIKTALSIGVGLDISWDLSIAKRGVQVLQFVSSNFDFFSRIMDMTMRTGD